jgi:hypothetical protein
LRTANSNSKRLFSGAVVVNGQEVYINIADGTGFKKVFELMEDVIHIFSKRRYMQPSCRSLEDAYQDVCVSVLEGMVKYQPDRHASLSTFLYLFIESRIKDSFKKVSVGFEEFHDLTPDRFIDPANRIDVMRHVEKWDERWKCIMFKLFVNEEDVASVARDAKMTPWGLTRAVRRKLQLVRDI